MKQALFLTYILILFFSFAVQTAEARSGCCSHHGGVCGCGCCDGSSLSAICAPYYPECNNSGAAATTNNLVNQPTTPPLTQPTVTIVRFTPRPTETPPLTPTPTVTPKPTKVPTPTIRIIKTVQVNKQSQQSVSFWIQLLKFFHFF
jgi:hypothetical protein